MGFSILNTIKENNGNQYNLHLQYMNPTFPKVLKIIGYDKIYSKAKNQYMWDTEGNRYLDFLSGYGMFNLGRNHEGIINTIKEILGNDPPSLVQMDCALLSGLLAQALVALSPDNIESVYFTNSGTESVEAAIKFSKAATKRPGLLSFDHAFHGLTNGSLSLNGNNEFKKGFEPLLPNCRTIPINDLPALERELKRKDVAALFVEPIQGKGVNPCTLAYLQGASALCRKYGTLLVADEVQTGLGRTGKMFAFEHYDIRPDIICVSKALSGGFVPVGAVLTPRKILTKTFSSLDRCVVHSSTFGQGNLAMACGLASLHHLQQERLLDNAGRTGELLRSGLNKLKNRYEMILDVRGKGLMLAVEFGVPNSRKLKLGWKMIHAADKNLFGQLVVIPLMRDHRILSQVAGHNVDIVKFLPPLTITEEDVRYFLRSFEDVMQQCHKFPGAIWDLGKTLALHALSNHKQKSTRL